MSYTICSCPSRTSHSLTQDGVLRDCLSRLSDGNFVIRRLSHQAYWQYSAFSALILLVEWQEGRPACKKTEWWGAGMVICLERGADLHMVQLMPLPLTVTCFSKIQIGFTFVVPAHLDSPRQRVVKRVCVCVCVLIGNMQYVFVFCYHSIVMLPPILMMKPKVLCFWIVRPSVLHTFMFIMRVCSGGAFSHRLAVDL